MKVLEILAVGLVCRYQATDEQRPEGLLEGPQASEKIQEEPAVLKERTCSLSSQRKRTILAFFLS